jgi:hypothetical protein
MSKPAPVKVGNEKGKLVGGYIVLSWQTRRGALHSTTLLIWAIHDAFIKRFIILDCDIVISKTSRMANRGGVRFIVRHFQL